MPGYTVLVLNQPGHPTAATGMSTGDHGKDGHTIALQDVTLEQARRDGACGGAFRQRQIDLHPLFEPPDQTITSSRIRLDDEDVLQLLTRKGLRQLRLHRMSMVFRRFSLFPHRSVLDNIPLGAVQGVKKRAPRSGNALAGHCRAEKVENSYPDQLGGGYAATSA